MLAGDEVKKVVVVPCKFDDEGKLITNYDTPSPRGFHHILEIAQDGSHFCAAAIFAWSVKEEGDLLTIAEFIADDKPVEVDYDFYTKLRENWEDPSFP